MSVKSSAEFDTLRLFIRPVLPLIDGVVSAGGDAGGIVAVLAHVVHIGHLDLGNLPPNMLLYPGPEMAGVGRGLATGVQSFATCSSS